MKPPESTTTNASPWPELKDFLKSSAVDYIPAEDMHTIPQLFTSRVKHTPDRIAYRQFDSKAEQWQTHTWEQTQRDVLHWRKALARENFAKGDRVAIRHGNAYNWVLFDQAALAQGLVVVPLYVDDRADNVAYVCEHSDARLLFLQHPDQWTALRADLDQLKQVTRVVIEDETGLDNIMGDDERIISLTAWLERSEADVDPVAIESDPDELATIVYTSGTTGRPKGVMLSHRNILSDIRNGLARIAVYPTDTMVSFLPLSHTLERTVGYYLPIVTGNEVVYARSVEKLAEDLQNHKPTILISVPRIFERVYGKIKTQLEEGSPLKQKLFNKTVEIGWARFEHRQGRGKWSADFLLWPLLDKLVASKVRAKLGGRLRFAISGGAPLPAAISKVFIGLGIEILQGYGLTETSPIISVNTLEFNHPASIGPPLKNIEVRIGENNELQSRGENVMLGYWKDPKATAAIMMEDGWIRSGDQAMIRDGTIYITGRLKEIIVLATGEKVPPADMESAIAEDPLFDQVMVIGEQKPFLSALVVLNKDLWEQICRQQGKADTFCKLDYPAVETYLLERIAEHIKHFPGYAQIRKVTASYDPWTIENGLTTPTMKMKRDKIEKANSGKIQSMYAGH